jgi:hypothetical protein
MRGSMVQRLALALCSPLCHHLQGVARIAPDRLQQQRQQQRSHCQQLLLPQRRARHTCLFTHPLQPGCHIGAAERQLRHREQPRAPSDAPELSEQLLSAGCGLWSPKVAFRPRCASASWYGACRPAVSVGRMRVPGMCTMIEASRP